MNKVGQINGVDIYENPDVAPGMMHLVNEKDLDVNGYMTEQEKKVAELKITYDSLLDNATTFDEYRQLQDSLEQQILAVYGLESKEV